MQIEVKNGQIKEVSRTDNLILDSISKENRKIDWKNRQAKLIERIESLYQKSARDSKWQVTDTVKIRRN